MMGAKKLEGRLYRVPEAPASHTNDSSCHQSLLLELELVKNVMGHK